MCVRPHHTRTRLPVSLWLCLNVCLLPSGVNHDSANSGRLTPKYFVSTGTFKAEYATADADCIPRITGTALWSNLINADEDVR